MKSLKWLLLAALSAGLSIRALAAPGHDHDHDHDHAKEAAKPPVKAEATDEHGHVHGDAHAHDAHADEVTLSPQAIEQNRIRIGRVEKRVLAQSFVAPARAAFNGDAMAHVGSPLMGRVTELPVKLGDEVKKGDVLAIVESPELGEAQSDFLLKRTTVETAGPAVKLARDAYDRARQLMDAGQAIALAELQKREAELRAAEGALRAAEAATTAAENKLHLLGLSQDDVATLIRSGEIVPRFKLLAPIPGQIVEREVTLGELVRPDRDALMIIADLSTVWVIADVPESRMGDVTRGSIARINVPAMRGKALEGKVTHIAAAVDPNTRSARVRIEAHDESATLRPGMFAQAELLPPPATNGEATLCIPAEAVQTVEGAPAVFVPVEGEPGTFAKRAVTVGGAVGGAVPVLSGLNDGESLVVSGSFILKAELGKAGAAHEH